MCLLRLRTGIFLTAAMGVEIAEFLGIPEVIAAYSFRSLVDEYPQCPPLCNGVPEHLKSF